MLTNLFYSKSIYSKNNNHRNKRESMEIWERCIIANKNTK